jgi:hypothetical protein
MSLATVIVFACLGILASGSYMSKDVKYADKHFLEKQKFIFDVFQHIQQDEVFGDLYESGSKFVIQDHFADFEKVEFVKEFLELYEHSSLHEHDIFSIFEEDHKDYAVALFHMFMTTKDWKTFYNTVLWARFHVNKGAFVYALTTFCIHNKHAEGIVVPAIYEIYPFYFFDAEAIQKAQQFKMEGFHDFKKVEGVYNVVIPVNYTGKHGHINEDNLLAYFHEDVGLNAFYYYYNLDYPHWYAGEEGYEFSKDRRGEFYFYLHHQILARYFMERLANNLGTIDEFSWNDEMSAGYFSGLRYYNGIHFPDRENHHQMYTTDNFYSIDMIEMYERRIMDGIDYGYFVKSDGTHFKFTDQQKTVETLANLIQGNADSINHKLYGNMEFLMRQIISDGITYGEFEEQLPGMLDHYSTSLRDPAFYMMFKRVLRYYWYFMDQFDSYTEEQLHFDGVKIEGVEMDKLTTYFDKFDSDITNAVDVELFTDETGKTDFYKFGRISNYHGHDFVVKARQYRLNHLPFNFKLNVHSDKAHKATVRVFIGPKYDFFGHKIHLNENRKNFFELDYFLVDLTEGKNVIQRNSDDFSWYVQDRTTYFELYKLVMLATNTDDHKFPLDMSEAHCGFPNRLMLPKGKKGGMPYQFYFMVSEYHEPQVKQFTGFDKTVSCGIGSGARYMDNTPFGFPFDREIDEKHFMYDNMFFYDTMIYHKTEADVNSVHSVEHVPSH